MLQNKTTIAVAVHRNKCDQNFELKNAILIKKKYGIHRK